MINFIVYDDEKNFRDNITTAINKVMMKNDVDYEIKEFEKYNQTFENIIEDDISSKIYLLDIEVEGSLSGIDIARKIRQKDWNSIIIMVTSHNELSYEALKAQIMLLDFISKFDNCKTNLEEVINLAVKKVDNKKVIVLAMNNTTYRIYLDDVNYIIKDTVDRKCIIHTTYNSVSVNKSLNEVMGMLDQRFFMSHRGCIVNLEKISSVNWTNSIIYFENGDSIDMLSRDKKKELKSYVGVD